MQSAGGALSYIYHVKHCITYFFLIKFVIYPLSHALSKVALTPVDFVRHPTVKRTKSIGDSPLHC